MNRMELLDRLSAASKWDRPPEVDVARLVVRRLAAAGERTPRFLAVFAGVAAAGAVAVTALAAGAWLSWTDPLSILMATVGGSLP